MPGAAGGSGEEWRRTVNGTLFGEAVNASTVATLLATDDGEYVAANDEACRLTGYSRSQLTEFRVGQLGADDSSKAIYDAISRRHEVSGIKTVRRRDGEIVRCRFDAVQTTVARTRHYLLMLRPVSATSA
jgi:PAS domain S-box-containing protein